MSNEWSSSHWSCFFEYVCDFAYGLIWVILYVVRILFEKRGVYEVRRYDVIRNWRKILRTGVIPMKFILIFGPQAVGKMTVGHELTKITELKLFHNHMSIELFHPFFGFGSETWRLSSIVRRELFESFASSNQYGLIFTYLWGFDLQKDWEFVKQTCNLFESKGAGIYFC